MSTTFDEIMALERAEAAEEERNRIRRKMISRGRFSDGQFNIRVRDAEEILGMSPDELEKYSRQVNDDSTQD